MELNNTLEQKLAEIPSIIVEGTMLCTREAGEAVEALSREDLIRTLDHYLNDGRTFYNGFGCPRLAEDFALEQVGSVALRRRDSEILARVSARYRVLAESATDEVVKEDFFQAASYYEVKTK